MKIGNILKGHEFFMRVLVPILRGGVSTLLSVGKRFPLVSVQGGREMGRRGVIIDEEAKKGEWVWKSMIW